MTHPAAIFASLADRLRFEGIDLEDPQFVRGLRRTLGFTLFLLTTLVLLVRPSDLMPELEGVVIYQYLIAFTIALSLPELKERLSVVGLAARPVAACVMGLTLTVLASHVAHLHLYEARVYTFEFFKIVAYFVVLTALVDSPRRLTQFLLCVVLGALIVTVVALLAYHDWLPVSASMAITQADVDPETGVRTAIRRLRGIGIFNDPNDLCLLLAVATTLCLYFSRRAASDKLQLACLGMAGLFTYTALETYSRGGFIGLLVGASVLFACRVGWRRGGTILAVLWLSVFMVVSARQTRVDLFDPEGTFQSRIQLWSQSMTLFAGAPLFGIGAGQLPERIGHVAHNSFIQSYTELGFFGGTLFLASFGLAFVGLARVKRAANEAVTAAPDADVDALLALGPCVLAGLAGYAAGLFSLSRNYGVPTYLMLGIAAAYLDMAGALGLAAPRITAFVARRSILISVVFLVVTYGFVRLVVRW